MNLASLQRFAPLLGLADKLAGDLSDGDLSTVATALAGDGSAEFFGLLKVLRDKEPATAVSEILSSPTAKTLLGQMQSAKEDKENVAFLKCPHCSQLFETELS